MSELIVALIRVAAAVTITAPILLAMVIDRQISGFQREAFGKFKDASRWLRIVGWAFFISQYAAIVVYGSFDGAVQGMFHYPLSKVSLGLYVQMVSVVLVFSLALGVSRKLQGIVRE